MGERTYPDLHRVYFDVDGVIADFEAAARAQGIAPAQLKLQRGLFPHEDPAPQRLRRQREAALDGIALLRAARPRDHHPDKGCVGKQRDFLIDDHPEWANARQFPGTIITFTGNWPSVVEQIRIGRASASPWPARSARRPTLLPHRPRRQAYRLSQRPPPASPFRAGMWIGKADQLGRVRYVHPEGTLDIVLFAPDGRQIGRASPAMGGPPRCSPEGWTEIAKPALPMTKFAFLHDLVEPVDRLST